MLLVASSRLKRVDAGSYGFVHQSRGSLYVGESSPTDVRARDDFPPAPSTTVPSRHDVPTWMPALVIEGVSGTGVDLFPSTTTSGDPSAASPSVRSMPGSIV